MAGRGVRALGDRPGTASRTEETRLVNQPEIHMNHYDAEMENRDHRKHYPDLLTGKPAPEGTGINVYRRGERVFAATLSEKSLDAILHLLELLAKAHER